MNENNFMFGVVAGMAATIMLIAVLVAPAINHTNAIINGDDVASYYGLPQPNITDASE